MISLIKNEFFKLFHKKSTLVFMIVVIAYLVLVNFIYKMNSTVTTTNTSLYVSDNTINNGDYDSQITEYQNLINKLNKTDETYPSDLATYETEIDVLKLKKEYSGSNWKINLISNDYYNIASNYYNALEVTKDTKTANEYLEQMNKIKNNLQTDNWQEYVKSQKEIYQNNVTKDEKALSSAVLEDNKKELNKDIELNKYLITLMDYRLDNNVSYEDNYLNTALLSLQSSKSSLLNYEGRELSDSEKESFNSLNAEFQKNEYIINNKVDVANSHNLHAVLQNFFSEFNFFIIVFVIMIGGSILSDEFSKGTIKSLLTMPYRRDQILSAKLITILLMIPIISIVLILAELLVGGLMFGFSTINLPVLVYNYATSTLNSYNLWTYLLIMFGGYAPNMIIMGVIAFTLSVLLTSTAFSITVSYCTIIASSIINSLAIAYDIKFLKYFLTPNWDFTIYLFGKTPEYKYINLNFSFWVYLAYLIIFLVISYLTFQKKNIKNI